jgi:Cytochrome P460
MRISMKFCGFLLVVPLLAAGCASGGPQITATFNPNASPIGALPANPLQWKIITSMLNSKDSTMATLYGNDVAVQYARTHAQHDYPNGASLALVTWTQTDDARWFGAKIPSQVKSVEFVFVRAAADGGTSYSYQSYEGAPLKLQTLQEGAAPDLRAAFLLSQRAAVMP